MGKRKAKSSLVIPAERIENAIFLIRRQKVMLDTDLAALYRVETFNLNKAVKRNLERFPEDFMFQLTNKEWEALKFQTGMSKPQGRGGRRIRNSRGATPRGRSGAIASNQDALFQAPPRRVASRLSM